MVEVEKIEGFVLDGYCEGCGEHDVKVRIGSIRLCVDCARHVLRELFDMALR